MINISIRDPYDMDSILHLVSSRTKPGTKKVRIHTFQSKERYCDECGHYTQPKTYEVEVTSK